MSNYTGPITVVEFVGPRDTFFMTFYPNVDEEDAIAKISDRLKEDGYKPTNVNREWYLVNGQLQERDHDKGWRPAAYKRMSAFLRA